MPCSQPCCWPAGRRPGPENRPFIFQNRFLTLGFDRHTGAWVSFQDRHTGNELVVSPAAGSLLGATVLLPLDAAALAKPIKEGQAVSLTGDWLSPQPPKEEIAADFLRGHFDGVSWATTPVPASRTRVMGACQSLG